MSSVYSKAKHIYFKMSGVPVLGRLCVRIAPFAQKIARTIDARSSSKTDIHKQIDILSQGLISLQRSSKSATQQEISRLERKVDECLSQVSDYRDRVEFVRLEIMEECSLQRQGGRTFDARPQPEILDREKYDAAVAANRLFVNIGCGHKRLADYLNVDRRKLPGVDVLADAARLPFETGTVSEIYAAHLVEHFTFFALKNTLFPYWLDLLAPQGVLKIVVPDMPAMIAAHLNGDMSFSDLGTVTFGAQDYDDDFHFSMFSPRSLQSMLSSSGFKYVEIIDENRVNGKCREMEVWARKL